MESPQPPIAAKKVLYGITKSNWGGAQAYVAMLASAAKNAGYEVAVMAGAASGRAGDGSGRLFSVLSDESIRTIVLSAVERDMGIMSEWRALKELAHVLHTEKPDVLHLNSSKMGVLGALAGRASGVRTIIFTAHGWPYLEQRPLWWKTVAWLGSWASVLLAHKVIVVSDYDLRTAPVLFFRDKLSHIDNGVRPFALKERAEARRELASQAPTLSEYSVLLFMTAELHPNKGIATAIRALSEIASEHPEVALVVCGEGEDRTRLAEIADSLGISARVFLLGFVADARRLLRAGDIFLMPSQKEGMPLALLEAGFASLPVIATKVGGIPDVITDQKTGLFMPRGNTDILAKAISYLLDNPLKATEYGSALHDHIVSAFSESQMTTKTLALYQ